MTCVRPLELADYARGALLAGAQEAVARHLDACPGCRVKLDRVTGAQHALRDAAELPAPEVGSIRTEATIRWTRVAPQPVVRTGFVVAFGLAAAAAATLLVWSRRPLVDTGAVATVKAPAFAQGPSQPTLRFAQGPNDVAIVTLLGGEVQLVRSGRARALEPEALLRAEDRLVTGPAARVAVQWGSGSGLLLNGDGEMVLSALERTRQSLALARGRVDVRVGPHQPGETLAVRTRGYVVTVRGTWFSVAAAGSRTTVEVYEGVVEVAEPGGRATTLLRAPAVGVFGPGRVESGPLDAARAAQLRAESEVNLVPWPSLAAARAATALLAIASEPAGTLALDGVSLGQTPMVVRRPLGRHLVEIARPGFQSLRRWVGLTADTGELRLALPHVVEHTMQPVSVEEMVHERGRQIRACYEHGLKRDPTLVGTVSLKLRVGDAGQVRSVSVEESTLSDSRVAECLKHEAAGWAFKTGRNATVVYPFVFRPQ